jgi:hypothetical protein
MWVWGFTFANSHIINTVPRVPAQVRGASNAVPYEVWGSSSKEVTPFTEWSLVVRKDIAAIAGSVLGRSFA